MMERSQPMILQLLHERAGIPVRWLGEDRGFGLYAADLTDLRLRFSADTPFILVEESDVSGDPAQAWNAVQELIAARHWQNRLPVIIFQGRDAYFKPKASLFRETDYGVGILDDQVAVEMSEARSCIYPMLDALLAQFPRTSLLPYETAAPVTGSAFFGRQAETRRLVDSDSSFAVTGVRRIGKTSLLLETQRILQRDSDCHFLVCSTFHSQDAFMREVVRLLRVDELRHVTHPLFSWSNFLRRMPKYRQERIVLFLDEADELIELDRATGYDLLKSLREATIVSRGGWRFVFAGSNVLERDCFDATSPLYNMVQLIPLGPFTFRQTMALVYQPFETVRVRIRDPQGFVARIHQETGGHPNIIQHYCMRLARLLDREDRRELNTDDLHEVYEDLAFQEYVLRSFETNTQPLEKLIVYSMARMPEFTHQDIDVALQRNRVLVAFPELDAACRHLEKAAILRKVGRSYRFGLAILPVMLDKNYDLDYLITKGKEELRA